jgi:hypothetical protein
LDEQGDSSLIAGRAAYERADSTYIADTFCLPRLSLSKMFDNEPGGIIGADYPRRSASAACFGPFRTREFERPMVGSGMSTTSALYK